MTVALSSMRDDHVLTFRSIESEIVAFDPVVYCVDVILQYSVILRTDNFPIKLLTYHRHKVPVGYHQREELLSHHQYR